MFQLTNPVRKRALFCRNYYNCSTNTSNINTFGDELNSKYSGKASVGTTTYERTSYRNPSKKMSTISTNLPDNTSDTLSKFRHYEANSKLPKILSNNSSNKFYTSLTQVPFVSNKNEASTKDKRNNSSQNIKTSSSISNILKNSIAKSNSKNIEKTNYFISPIQMTNLEIHMKNKYYSDVEKKMNKKYCSMKDFRDQNLKDKIITLRKVNEFWSGVTQFISPLLVVKKYQYSRKLNDFKKRQEIQQKTIKKIIKGLQSDKLDTDELYVVKNGSNSLMGKSACQKKKKPLLYTTFGFNESRHVKKVKDEQYLKSLLDKNKIYNFC